MAVSHSCAIVSHVYMLINSCHKEEEMACAKKLIKNKQHILLRAIVEDQSGGFKRQITNNSKEIES